MIKSWRKRSGKKHGKTEHERFCEMTEKERTLEYLRLAEEGWNHAWDIYHSDGWKISSGKDLNTGIVTTKHDTDGRKVFKLDGNIDAKPEEVFNQLVYGDNDSPEWNPTVLFCKTLQKINENTDIAYNIGCQGAGGLVSSRDFVNLRHWKLKDGYMLSLGLSTCHPDAPPGHKYVRGENSPAAWVFKPLEDPQKCHFTLILKTDLKGWLPHYLVDQSLTGVLVNYIKYLRDRLHHVKNNTTQGVSVSSWTSLSDNKHVSEDLSIQAESADKESDLKLAELSLLDKSS